MTERTVVAATKNKGKLREFEAIFATIGYRCVPVADVCDVPEPEETGTTFAENAALKARYYADACGRPCVADDSGLEVDALGGAPGVYSARYAGTHASDVSGDDANNERLLRELRGILPERRTARYVCALAFAEPGYDAESERLKGDASEVVIAEGRCEGIIIDVARGDGGFGYDPYFYLPVYDRTMAELSLEEKNKISHRGQALRRLGALIEARDR